MAKISISLFNKDYNVTCGAGEEPRLRELVRFVEGKMREVSTRAGNTTEPRLFMLTCLQMADELFEIRRKIEENALQDEELLVAAVEHLGERITHIASQVGRA